MKMLDKMFLSAFSRLIGFLDIEHQSHSLLFLFGVLFRMIEQERRLISLEVDINHQLDSLKNLEHILKNYLI